MDNIVSPNTPFIYNIYKVYRAHKPQCLLHQSPNVQATQSCASLSPGRLQSSLQLHHLSSRLSRRLLGGGPFFGNPDGLQLLPGTPLQTRPCVAEVPAAHPEAVRVSPVVFPPALPDVVEVLGSRAVQATGRRLAVATGPYRAGLPCPLPEATNITRVDTPSWSGGGTGPPPVLLGVPARLLPRPDVADDGLEVGRRLAVTTGPYRAGLPCPLPEATSVTRTYAPSRSGGAIGRTLIPRYFRSIFEGGATELYYVLKHPKESFHNNFVSLDCDQCTMVTQNGKPMFTQVCVEGRLYLEFMFDDMMRIKTWHFSIRQHRELIPRSILAMHLCVILEPMQELMSRHKTYSLSPRDCLKTCLFQKWQRMVAPPAEPARQAPSKRRKRKMSGGSTMSSGGGTNSNSNSKKKSPASSFALSSQDVMVVGEPTLMGGEFGDEDERLITRLENTQFDAANGIDDEDSFNNSPALGANSPWNSKAPSSQESKNDNPTSQASQ
ncbi:LDB1 protein, partial [Polypterus senegalus]